MTSPTPFVRFGRLRFFWLWSDVYKGLSVEWDERKQILSRVYTGREFKRRGW